MERPVPTKTQSTKERYIYLSLQRAQQYESDTGQVWSVDPMSFCQWFEKMGLVSDWSRSTWRQYRAALVYFMQTNGPKSCSDFLLELKNPITQKKKTPYGAARKKKGLSDEDLRKIIGSLDSQAKWDPLIALWLVASIYTGLRPGEWKNAEIINGSVLKVENAKHTNGRSNGAFRRLDLSELSDEKIRVIEACIAKLKSYEGESFEKVYEGARSRLRILTNELWPRRAKRPTLYSSRHQFRADASAYGFELDEIAAMMGHATDYTASRHYGRKAIGESRGGMVKPYRDEVATVRLVSDRIKNQSSRPGEALSAD